MSFVNPFFLIALAGAAVPILIHLLTRDRIQHAAFSTMRFFAKGAKLVVRRKKFQEMILLIMRVLLLALLAFTFARPFFAKKTIDTRHEFATARVVVLDVSGSMQRPGLPEALKKEAQDATSSLNETQDAGGVITFSDSAEVVVPLGDKIADVKAAASAVTPGYGGTNIADALRKANELLLAVRAQHKEIVLVSDLQREGWHYFKGDWKLAKDVKLTVRQVTPTDTGGGLAIVEMSAPNSLVLDKQPSSIAVRIANYSDQPRNNVDVALILDGKKADGQQVNVRANGTVAVRFRHVFDTPGDNPGSIVVGSDPSTPANTVFFNARMMPKIPVLLINGHPSVKPEEDGAFFLDKALVPTDESPFAVKIVTSSDVTPADVTAATVTILANVGQVSAPVSDALAARIQNGGGVLFLPGNQVNADTFNSEFGSISPCKLRQVLQAHPANGETAESLTRIDFDHPIFDIFALPHHGDLSLPKFAQYWETTDTQLSQVLARFGDGRPAIVEKEIGKGVSVAMVSAIEDDWTDFARQSVFLPFVHQTVRYLAVQTGQQTTYTSGDLLPVPTGDTLKDPQGKTEQASELGGGKTGVYATQPGFYDASTPQGAADLCFAVNGNMAESSLAIIPADEIAAAIERASDDDAGLFGSDEPTKDEGGGRKDAGLWWYLVWGILGLSLAELVLGNKTLRH